MAQAYQLRLNPQQEQELQYTLKHDEKPYLRERCSALLKVAQGCSIRQVAAHGLLQVRSEETLSQWITRYLHEGLPGLLIRAGRGRKPAFSPCGTEL